MKKFIYSFAVVAAMGLVACGGAKTETTEAPAAEEVTEVVAEEVTECCGDSACCAADSTACCDAEAPAAEAPAAE